MILDNDTHILKNSLKINKITLNSIGWFQCNSNKHYFISDNYTKLWDPDFIGFNCGSSTSPTYGIIYVDESNSVDGQERGILLINYGGSNIVYKHIETIDQLLLELKYVTDSLIL